MREIVFRGMTLGGEWVYGNLSVLKQKIDNIEAGTYISNSAGLPFAYAIRPETVGQYTELLDMAGKRIFSGDADGIGVVSITEGAIWYEINNSNEVFLLREVANRIEIKGNIIENPELLK